MDITVIRTIYELKLYKNEWDRILQENKNDIPFIEFDWVSNWWSFLGRGHELFVLLITDGGNIAGFCPMMLTNRKFYGEISFMGYPQANNMDIVIHEKYKDQAVKFLIDYFLNNKDRLIYNIHGLFEKSGSFNILKEYLKICGVRYFFSGVESRFIKIDGYNFEDYLKTRNKHSSIRNIQNYKRKAQKLGILSYVELESQQIDKIFSLHHKRWLKKLDTSGFSEGNIKEFFKYLALEKNMTFKTSIGSLYLNDEIIAYIYGFEIRGRYLLYTIAHDNDFSVYGAGKIALSEEIKKQFIQKQKIMDFSIGIERYKSEWTDDSEYVNKVVFPSKNPVSRLVFIGYYLKEHALNVLKKNSRIVDFKRNTLGKIRYFLSRDSIIPSFKRLKNYIENESLFKLIRNGIQKIAKVIYCRENFDTFKWDLADNIVVINPEYLVREATIKDRVKLAGLMNEEPADIVQRFYNNHKCVVIENNGLIIHCQWMDLPGIGANGIKQTVNPVNNGAYIYEYYTKKEFRGRDVFRTFLRNILGFLQQNNFNHCYFTLNARDKIAVEGLREYGFKYESSVKRLKQ